MKKVIIYCWATGQIEYGNKLPNGALPIISVATKKEADHLIVRHCVLSRTNNKDYFSPEIGNQGEEGIEIFEKKMKATYAEDVKG